MARAKSDSKWRNERRRRDGGVRVIGGRVYARIQYIDPFTGRRKERLRRAENRTHAKDLVREMRLELINGGVSTLEADSLKFKDLAERYAETNIVPAKYENGIKIAGRRSVAPLKSSLVPLITYFGRKHVRAIKRSDIEAYKLQRLNTPIQVKRVVNLTDDSSGEGVRSEIIFERQRKIASVNRELALLRTIFSFAKAEELMIKSPFESGGSLISLAAETQRERILTPVEEQTLLMQCVGPRSHLRSLIIIAVDTGMRKGELLKLRWADVDLNERTVLIRAYNAKTERSRIVPLSSRSVVELQSRLEESSGPRDGFVFGITDNFKHSWTTACRLAGIDGLRFHDLRHTATTRMIRAGIPSAEVMKITGHSQVKTFLRYLNLNHESLRSSAAAIDRYHEVLNAELATCLPLIS